MKSKAGLQPLFDRIGDARVLMLGEASHGTHEYYTLRAYITKHLVEEESVITIEDAAEGKQMENKNMCYAPSHYYLIAGSWDIAFYKKARLR